MNPGKFARVASGLLLVSLVLFISLLSASPAAHKFVHADSGEAQHHCIVTEFIKGQVHSADVAPMVVGLVVLFGGVVLLSETLVFPLADYRFSASRAPPV